MPTPQEELFIKMDKAIKAYSSFLHMSMFGRPFLPFGKNARKYKAFEAEVYSSEKEYLAALFSVLKGQHGITPLDVVSVDPIFGYTQHEFRVMVGRKVRNFEARGIGNRVVFFID
jgi:hypothetical protein